MLFCARENVTDFLLEGYASAYEAQNTGIIERTMEAVSQEIADMLSYRYPQPWDRTPDLVRYIAATLSAYRIVSAITTLVTTEGSTDNEWIPLQKQWKYCTDMLTKIAAGTVKLPLPEANADREDASIAVVSRGPFFDLRGF
ncbi:MAG: phage protein Gp36 family protein [Pseudomonadota bacterium]